MSNAVARPGVISTFTLLLKGNDLPVQSVTATVRRTADNVVVSTGAGVRADNQNYSYPWLCPVGTEPGEALYVVNWHVVDSAGDQGDVSQFINISDGAVVGDPDDSWLSVEQLANMGTSVTDEQLVDAMLLTDATVLRDVSYRNVLYEDDIKVIKKVLLLQCRHVLAHPGVLDMFATTGLTQLDSSITFANGLDACPPWSHPLAWVLRNQLSYMRGARRAIRLQKVGHTRQALRDLQHRGAALEGYGEGLSGWSKL